MIPNPNLNSQKIMQKLKEIKKTFDENYNQQNIDAFKNSDLKSRENQKLQKYLPQSMSQIRQNQQIKRSFKQSHNMYQQSNRAALTFRKTLEEKLQNLFDEEKNLLKKRYQMNLGSNYINQLKQSRNKHGKSQSDNQSHISIRQADYSNIMDMENKIRILVQQILIQEKRVKTNEHQQQYIRQSKNKKFITSQSDNELKKQLMNLRDALIELKSANMQLQAKLQKKQRKNKSTIIEKQRQKYYTKRSKMYQSEIRQLKKQIEHLKYKTNQICQARVNSRIRNTQIKQQKAKKHKHDVLLDLYSQIDEFKYKLNRQVKQKILLQQKNAWLQQQLRSLMNKFNKQI